MGFRNPLTALSELFADTVIGAVLQTAGSLPWIKIYQASPTKAVIEFDPLSPPALPAELFLSEAGLIPQYALSMASPETPAGRRAQLSLVSSDAPGSERERAELVASEGLRINGLGSFLRAIDWGVFTGTTDANGDVVVPHGLGATPTGEFAQPTGPTAPLQPYRQAHSASSTTWRMRNTTTNAIPAAGTSVTFYWLVLR